jgi:hypothetical protein
MTAQPQERSRGLPALAALAAVLGFVALQLAAYSIAGGVFEYPLDDVYIHLAMAESIAAGEYGINPGEAASAASSILYPFLLAPLSGFEAQRYLPLAINFAAIIAAGWLWGTALVEAGLRGVWGIGFALGGPIALNMPGVGFTGMEHSLHAAAALATVIGLWRFLNDGRIGWLLIIGSILAPLMRLEGLALSLLTVAVLILHRRIRAGLLLGAAVLLPVAGFAVFLTSMGLAPLPGSVMAKVGLAAPDLGGVDRLIFGVLVNLAPLAGKVLGVLTVALGIIALILLRKGERSQGTLAGVLALAGAAHLVGGQIGWMHRYEHYILVAQMAGLIIASGGLLASEARLIRLSAATALAVAGVAFYPSLFGLYLWNPRAIHLQHEQMARFAQDYLKAPVVLNDLGRVAWRNPNHVFDAFGLGSPEALDERLRDGGPQPGWLAPYAEETGARLAMLYDKWFGTAVGPDWVRVASLEMSNPHGALGGMVVSFYATDPAAVPELSQLLEEFSATLPEDAKLSIAAVAQ